MQQLPIGGQPAFKRPQVDPSAVNSNVDDARLRKQQCGFKVYSNLNYVVMLDENIRHKDCPEYAAILSRWRFGVYLQEDLDWVNKRCYQTEWKGTTEAESSQCMASMCPIIISSHILREEINRACMRQAKLNSPEMVMYEIPAKISRGMRSTLSQANRRSLYSLRYDKTDKLPMVCHLAVGMPVMCTKNVAPNLLLCNGTLAYVSHIQHHPENITTAVDLGNGFIVHRCSRVPEVVFLKLLDRNAANIEFVPGKCISILLFHHHSF